MPTKQLTEAMLKRLKPKPDKQISYFDTAARGAAKGGLVFRISPGGARTFSVLYYRDARPKYHMIGRYPDVQLKGARDIARTFLDDPKAALEKAQTGTFQEMADKWFKRHVQKEKLRSEKEIRRRLDKYTLPRIGEKQFRDIGKAAIADFLESIEDQHGATQSERCRADLSGIMNYAEERIDDYISPLHRRRRRSGNQGVKKEKRFLDDDEIQAFWTACDETPIFGPMLQLALLTAQRISKVQTLKWDDIVDGIWEIDADEREKLHAGKIKLSDKAREIIDAQDKIAGNFYMFPALRGPGPSNSFGKSKNKLDEKMKALLEGSDLQPWRIHDLRRTARKLLTRAKIRPDVAELCLGHSIKGIQEIYDDRAEYQPLIDESFAALADEIENILHR